MSAPTTQEILRATTSGQVASMHFGCPHCGRSYILPVAGDGVTVSGARLSDATAPPPAKFPCDDCGFEIPLSTGGLRPQDPVDCCALCGGKELFLQKDFNRLLGLWVVVGTGLVALLVMLLVDHVAGLAVLGALTLVDWLLFRRLRDVAVCYLCNTIYRGFPRHSGHGPFDLGNEERFKKLRQDWIRELKA